jgi:hypothetical protein
VYVLVGSEDARVGHDLVLQRLGDVREHGGSLLVRHALDRVEVALEAANEARGREHVERHPPKRVPGIALVVVAEAAKVVGRGQAEPHALLAGEAGGPVLLQHGQALVELVVVAGR